MGRVSQTGPRGDNAPHPRSGVSPAPPPVCAMPTALRGYGPAGRRPTPRTTRRGRGAGRMVSPPSCGSSGRGLAVRLPGSIRASGRALRTLEAARRANGGAPCPGLRPLQGWRRWRGGAPTHTRAFAANAAHARERHIGPQLVARDTLDVFASQRARAVGGQRPGVDAGPELRHVLAAALRDTPAARLLPERPDPAVPVHVGPAQDERPAAAEHSRDRQRLHARDRVQRRQVAVLLLGVPLASRELPEPAHITSLAFDDQYHRAPRRPHHRIPRSVAPPHERRTAREIQRRSESRTDMCQSRFRS